MNKSEAIESLAGALSRFQGEIQNAFKGKKGYGYNYADLASILEDVRPILNKNGLCITQLAGNSGESVSVETVLMHDSGQWISETIQMPVDIGKGMSRAQAIGSVISYARRYALTSCLGIAQTDNDASVQTISPPRLVASPHKELSAKLMELGCGKNQVSESLKWFNCERLVELPVDKFDEFLDMLAREEVANVI